MRKYLRPLLAVLLVLTAVGTSRAQTTCDIPQITYSRGLANIFTEEQDVFLGDALAETLDKEMVVIADDAATAYLHEIGARIERHLPPTQIKFRFFIVDAPELNAFSVAGGRIYVTRKLVSFVKSEDELAGILGHEMGHAVVRHQSADLSRAFKEVLNVDVFRDRADVYHRVHQLMDRSRTKRIKRKQNHEDKQQLEADQIGLYAMTAAGYDPNANITAWQRLTETERDDDRRGGWFGGSKPEYKRLREMLRSIEGMPATCREKATISRDEDFRKWKLHVVSIAKVRHKEQFSGLISKGRLLPYLRGSVKHLRFSPDGRYIIAQDASGINILAREPFVFLFRINIDDAKFANFSPDSKSVIVQTFGLRVEAWDIATRRASSVQEVYVRDRCLQTRLSPDGKTMACYSVGGDLHFIDVETSGKIFSKEKFYSPGGLVGINWLGVSSDRSFREVDTIEMEFSPDGRYFLGGAVFRPTMIGNFPGGRGLLLSVLGQAQKSCLGFDLTGRKEVKVPESLKEIVSMPFTFYSNDKILGQHIADNSKSGIFTFPTGNRVEKFFLSAQSYEKTTGGDYIIVRPIMSAPAGVYSVPLKKFVLISKSAAVDGFEDVFVSEGLNGSVDLLKMSTGDEMEKVASLVLPKNELGDVRTVAVSDNLDRIALSERVRGGVWDLKTGTRKIYIRGFRGSYADPNGGIYADLPAFEDEQRSIALLDMNTGAGKALRTLKRNIAQIGKFLVGVVPAKDPKTDGEDSEQDLKQDAALLRQRLMTSLGVRGFSIPDMKLEVSDAASGKLLWSKSLEDDVPGFSFSPDGKTVSLRWGMASAAASDIIKKSPGLSEKARQMGEKAGDHLIQVLDAEKGNAIGQLLIETGEGSFRIKDAFATGDWLTVIDSENRVLFYSIKTGELKVHIFGEEVLVNPQSSIAIVQNLAGVLSIEDLNSGKRISELRFPSSIIHVKFTNDGSKLFVLTASQEYYIFDASRLAQGN